MKQIIQLLILTIPCFLIANNGKLAYTYPNNNIVIDGEINEWSHIQEVNFGPTTMSLKCAFKTSYNTKTQSLNFIVEVEDDNYKYDPSNKWYQNDNLVIYLDPIHSELASTCGMIVANKVGITLYQPDEDNQLLSIENIKIIVKKTLNKTIYEGSIFLDKYIYPNRSIGFDLMIVDADDGRPTTYNNWGVGGSKEYRSGQLGDLVMLEKSFTKFGTCAGNVNWEDNKEDAIPSSIKIKSKPHPKFWVIVKLDSSGHFLTELPIGEYYISAADKIGSPMSDNGYSNQIRIDERFRMDFSVMNDSTTNVEDFLIPTFKFPEFLYQDYGVLHNYSDANKTDVDAFIKATCNYYNIPGASVALIKEGKVVYHNIFGVENLLTQQSVSDTTVFQAASVTKAVFAFIVLRLVEKGIIDLDKPLYQYLPFENIAHDKFYKKLTAKWILSHQSGLPNWAFGGPGGYASQQKTNLDFEPGTQYQYSGEAFEYLGRVVEHLTDKDLKQLLEEEVITALGIPPLYFCDDGTLRQARGHYADGRPTYYGPPFQPGVAHSMLSEANAFAHWVAALANEKGLSEKMYQRLTQRLSTTNNFDSPEHLYWNVGVSLGFFVQDTPFGKAILHGGNNGDFQAEFVLLTEKKLGFVVFTNSNSGHKLGQHLGKYLIHGM